jgi:hypothetical protein
MQHSEFGFFNIGCRLQSRIQQLIIILCANQVRFLKSLAFNYLRADRRHAE